MASSKTCRANGLRIGQWPWVASAPRYRKDPCRLADVEPAAQVVQALGLVVLHQLGRRDEVLIVTRTPAPIPPHGLKQGLSFSFISAISYSVMPQITVAEIGKNP